MNVGESYENILAERTQRFDIEVEATLALYRINIGIERNVRAAHRDREALLKAARVKLVPTNMERLDDVLRAAARFRAAFAVLDNALKDQQA